MAKKKKKELKKTLFLSGTEPYNANPDWDFRAPYIFFHRGKWREDYWYFDDKEKIKRIALTQGYLIQ